MHRMGYVLSPYGGALADRPVDVRNATSGALIISGTTNDDGRWEFDLADDAIPYRVEISMGDVSLQKIAQAPASIELEYLFVRYGLTFAPAASVDLPVDTTIGGDPLDRPALDARYVNVAGDTMTGDLILRSPLTVNTGAARGGVIYTGGVIFQTTGGPAPFGDAQIRVSGGDAQNYHGTLQIDASLVSFSGALRLDQAAPTITLREGDAPANNQVVTISQPSGDGRLRIQAFTDAGVGGTSYLDITRANQNLTNILFGGGMTLGAPLTVNNGAARGGGIYTGGVIFQTLGGPAPFGDAQIRVSGGDAQDYHGTLALQANRVELGAPGVPSVIASAGAAAPALKVMAIAGHGVTVVGGFYTEANALTLGATRFGPAFAVGMADANVMATRHFVTKTIQAYDSAGAFVGYLRVFDTSN
jgi:hypothetical protein